MQKGKVILFSGRFDPPHLGHFITIANLTERYQCVIVVVLDQPGADYSTAYRLRFLGDALSILGARVRLCAWPHHFARVSKKALRDFPYAWDVYGSGNDECLKHMAKLGYPTEYVPRSGEYAATQQRVGARVLETVRKATHG